MGVRCLPKHAVEVVVDLDVMGHLIYGTQEGRHFNAYYGDYCYLPLYVFVGAIPLWAQLRTSDHDAAQGVVPALEKIVTAIRKRCRQARIIVRGDTGRNAEMGAFGRGGEQVTGSLPYRMLATKKKTP
jgi:hypothetical protein